MQDNGHNEFDSPFCTQRFFRQKRDKEDVASFIQDEVRGIEEEFAKKQIIVCFSMVVKNFNMLQFFPEQTTESRSGTDRDKIRRLKVGQNRMFLSNNHFGIIFSYFDRYTGNQVKQKCIFYSCLLLICHGQGYVSARQYVTGHMVELPRVGNGPASLQQIMTRTGSRPQGGNLFKIVAIFV